MAEEFRQVGQFPERNRRLIRHPKNPLDKCTIISILPKLIDEIKHTIEPGRFVIQPGSFENPTTLVVGPSSWWKDVDAEQPMIEIPNSSITVASSIITDYCNGMFGCNMTDAMPGLFFVLGVVKPLAIKLEYQEKLNEAKAKQDKWFETLLMLADALWANSNNNPLAISNEMRLAAKMLGAENKPWLKNFQLVDMVRCLGCGSMKDPNYPICPTCRMIDPSHTLAKDMKFA